MHDLWTSAGRILPGPTSLGGMPVLTSPPPVAPRADARRLRPPRWTHPRAVAGAALVAVSMLLGGLLVSTVAATTEVWAVSADVRAGEPVRVDDLERVDVRLSGGAAEAYLAETDADALAAQIAEATWARDLTAGELVPVAALTSATSARGVELPLEVAGTSMPADLGPGHRVDVWVADPDAAAGGAGRRDGGARRILDDVAVLAVHGEQTALGEGAARSVVVLVEDAQASALPQALAALSEGAVTVVRRQGTSS